MGKVSSWREATVVRKVARQAPAPEAPKTRGVPNKRDTKRWGRGSVNVAHKPAVKTYAELKHWQGLKGLAQNIWQGWLVRYCSECGKELEHYTPPWGDVAAYLKPPPPPPEWAEDYFQAHPEERKV